MPKMTNTVLGEVLRLHRAGWWVVPQIGRGASVLGWDKWRMTEEDLTECFTGKNHNVAVVLSQSPFIDVECDGDEATAEFARLTTGMELVTPTWQSRRGKHRLFIRPDSASIPQRAKVTADLIEFRLGNGKGALTTVPPSTADGFTRKWLPGLSVFDVEPMELPEPLLKLLQREKKKPSTQTNGGAVDVESILKEGSRNDGLNRLGCRLLNRVGLSADAILEALRAENKRCCKPPLPDAEVKLIAASVEKLRPRAGDPNVQAHADELLPCAEWKTVHDHWRKAMKWTEGLDTALSVMLATIASTEAVGDQLWIKIVSPPSSGKSVLCEAISTNRRYVYPKDTLTGLFSGFQVDREGSENMSLAGMIKNKTLAIKDGDTVLQAPNRPQILSQFRALYDRCVRVSYGNKMSKDWEGMNTTVILCGTSSLRQLDTSELGERFLDCIIVDEIDDALEDEVNWRIANRAFREMSFVADGKMETREGPEMVLAKRLTGGYVEFLRLNAAAKYRQLDENSDALRDCTKLGKFVAYMRARPSAKQEEKAERELSYRLTSQLVRLATSLAVVLNKPSLDAEVMRRVKKVALDTARGRTTDICRHLREVGMEGKSTSALALLCSRGEDKKRAMLQFLRKIGVVELFAVKNKETGQPTGQNRWRMTPKMTRLYDEVLDVGVTNEEE